MTSATGLFGILTGALLGFATPALGAGPLLVVGELGPRTCVSGPELRDALARSGLQVGADGAVSGAGGIRVDVAGTPDELVVSLHDGGRVSDEPLSRATCSTATDVVAAFVASALAPPPVVEVPPPPPPSPGAVEASLREGLVQRSMALEPGDAALDLREDDAGLWRAKLDDHHDPACSRAVPLGHFADLSPDRRAAATSALFRALETYRTCVAEERRKRAGYLADALEHLLHERPRSTLLVVDSVVLILEGGLSLFQGAQPSPNGYLGFSSSHDALATTGSGAWVAGGVAGLLAPADYRQGVVETSLLAGAGAFWAAAAIGVSATRPSLIGLVPERPRDEAAYSRVALSAASFSTAGLVAVSTALRPPPLRRLQAAYREVRTDEGQAHVSRHRLSEMESDLERLDPAIPHFVQYSPLIIGGAVAMAPAIADGFGSADRNYVAMFGAMYLLFGAIGAAPFSPFRDYQRALVKAGFHDVGLGMGAGDGLSFSLTGRF